MAACDLLASLDAIIVECACMVELKALGGYQKLQSKHPSTQVVGSAVHLPIAPHAHLIMTNRCGV
jgi:hypothetical protein